MTLEQIKQETFRIGIRNFYRYVRNFYLEKHGFEKVWQAMENYALSEWHQDNQAWKFIQIFTGKDFIGNYVNRRPQKRKDYEQATREFLKYAGQRKTENEL